MLRKLGFFAVLVMLIAATYAAAANLEVNGGAVQAGVDADLYCDSNGVKVTGWGYEKDNNSVYFVKIGDIDSACAGKSLHYVLRSASGGKLAEGTVQTIDTEEVTFTFPSPINATLIESLQVAIEGAGN